MRITRIDFEGKPGYYATAQHRRTSGGAPNIVVVTIITPEQPNGREHRVTADCEDDIRSMAKCLQYHLDGVRGTSSDVHDYYLELLRLSDI